ncbi:hypothetical protein [Halorussus caseinilyticus]|uniref:Uncharacterized protein n=1 Tax=Halorussus caseinilyticus TaxID=3034025 RepID=A0ABD5WLD2_9EURY
MHAPRGESETDQHGATIPQSELRWVQLDAPRHAIEIGPNGRILDSRYHGGYDAWEVLLETYEGEVSG